MRFGLILLLLLAGTATADTWECQSGLSWSESGDIVVKAQVEPSSGDASVTVAGMKQPAKYSVMGFNRAWFFKGTNAKDFQYRFDIMPDGSAHYYEFSSDAWRSGHKPSQLFICKPVKQ